MPFAGEQQHVARVSSATSSGSRAAVAVSRGGAGGRGQDGAAVEAASSLRGLSSVTMTRSSASSGDLAHHRTLAGVTVAAAAEHHDQPAATRDERRKDGLEGLGGVCIESTITGAPFELRMHRRPAPGGPAAASSRRRQRVERCDMGTPAAAGTDRRRPPRFASPGTRRTAANAETALAGASSTNMTGGRAAPSITKIGALSRAESR